MAGVMSFAIGSDPTVPVEADYNVATGAVVDTTIAETLDLTAQFSVADVLNSITCNGLIIEVLR